MTPSRERLASAPIGRVHARAAYDIIPYDDEDPGGGRVHETGRLDKLLVSLYDRHATCEIDSIRINVGDVDIPSDAVAELFAAMRLVELRR